MSASIVVESVLIVATVSVAWCLPFTSIAIQMYLYQGLSGLLAALTVWRAVTTSSVWTALLAVIPIGLAVSIPKLLRRIGSANAFTARSMVTALARADLKRHAISLLSIVLPAAALTIITLAPAVMWWGLPLRQAAGVMLILVGLCLWLARAELTAQVVGWLVMDHALFLLAEPLVLRSSLTFVLLVVLSLYLLIPFIHVLFVLPRLLQNPLGFDADHHHNLWG